MGHFGFHVAADACYPSDPAFDKAPDPAYAPKAP